MANEQDKSSYGDEYYYDDNIDYKKEATVFYQGANLNNKDAIVAVKFAPAFFDTLKMPAAGINDIFFSKMALNFFMDAVSVLMQVHLSRHSELISTKALP